MNQSINDVINDIFDKFGDDILLNGGKFCAVLDDLAPQMTMERRVIHRLFQESMLGEIYTILSQDDFPGKMDVLLTSAGFSDEWKNIVYQAFGFGDVNILSPNVTNYETSTDETNIQKLKYFAKNQAKKLYPTAEKIIRIPEKFTAIGSHAFEYLDTYARTDCIIIPNTVKEIQNRAFYNILVEDYIDIPSSVTYIGEFEPFKLGKYAYIKCEPNSYAYEYCKKNYLSNSVDSIPIRPSIEKMTSEKAKNVVIKKVDSPYFSGRVLVISNVVSIEKEAFRNRSDFDVLILDEDVKYIKQNAFRGCKNLKYVFYSSDVCSIAANSFEGCENLKYLNFDSNYGILKTFESKTESFFLADTAFDNCNQLKYVVSAEDVVERYCDKKGIKHFYLTECNEREKFSGTDKEFADITVEAVHPFLYERR